jgi:type VII secretion effector (TIGR04197 family)
MTRIRVNTEELKIKAKDFESAAEAINRAGEEILATAMEMPSYDGQLSGPARKAGYEIQSQCRELKAALSNDAESLLQIAADFERVDNQIVHALSVQQNNITDYLNVNAIISTPFFIQFGDEIKGFSYDPATGILIIWNNGKAIAYDLKLPLDDKTRFNLLLYTMLIFYREILKTGQVASLMTLVTSFVTGTGSFLAELLPSMQPAATLVFIVSVAAFLIGVIGLVDSSLQLQECNSLIDSFFTFFSSADPGFSNEWEYGK